MSSGGGGGHLAGSGRGLRRTDAGRMCLALPRAPALNLDNRQGLIVAVGYWLVCHQRGVSGLCSFDPHLHVPVRALGSQWSRHVCACAALERASSRGTLLLRVFVHQNVSSLRPGALSAPFMAGSPVLGRCLVRSRCSVNICRMNK